MSAQRRFKNKWKELAPGMVRTQAEGFDWLAYRGRMDDIRYSPKVLHDEPRLREMHAQFARICLAYLRLAEADIDAARAMWRTNVPAEVGVLQFLDPKWLADFAVTRDFAHLAPNGVATPKLWEQLSRTIHFLQDDGAILKVLDPIPADAQPMPAP